MRIWLCPNAFKECLTAAEAARAMARGVRRAWPGVPLVELPLADGGDGTLEALVRGTRGRFRHALVHDPLGRPIRARYGVSGDGHTGFVEMARASGLALVPRDRRDPLRTSTRGTGELIRRLLDRGVGEIVVGVGGSATVDGGMGAARALGFRFLDRHGREVPEGGGGLAALACIDAAGCDSRLARTSIRVACDVRNPLLGPTGAARVFGPQKGAGPRAVRALERGLARLAEVLRRDLGCDVDHLPGGGAAGGLAAGLHAFCRATLEPGADLILGMLRFSARVARGDLVTVGEGRLDRSTRMGKAPHAAAEAALRAGARVIAVCGSAEPAAAREFARRFGPVYSLVADAGSTGEAMKHARAQLATTCARAVAELRRPRSL